MQTITQKLDAIMAHSRERALDKHFAADDATTDLLMEAYALDPKTRHQHMQFWGQRLGLCWEGLVDTVFSTLRPDAHGDRIHYGRGELCDMVFGDDAIDTKYRIGSGDGATIRKFCRYGDMLREDGYRPVMLILRTDSLDQSIHRCAHHWEIYQGDAAFDYIHEHTDYDLRTYLHLRKGHFKISLDMAA